MGIVGGDNELLVDSQADRAEAYEHMRLAKKHGERGASHDVASASADI